MSTVVSIAQDDERLEAASRWLLKMDEGTLSAEDNAALGVWLDEDPRHREVLLEVSAVWDKTDALALLAKFFPHDVIDRKRPTVAKRRPWVVPAAIAASLMVLAASIALLLPSLRTVLDGTATVPTQIASFETAIGEQKTVLLPDGSEVVLNTNSELSLTFTASARVLNLVRGEVFVQVAKERRPFSVIAIDQIVQAKGTEFSVEITKDQHVEVIVTEGTVVVEIQPKSSLPLGTKSASGQGFVAPPVFAQLADNTLSAGEEVTLRVADSVTKDVSADDIEVRLSWTKERLIFRSEPLEKALQEVERYTNVKFVILDEQLKSETVSGIFKTGDVEGLLASLKVNAKASFRYETQSRVLLSSL